MNFNDIAIWGSLVLAVVTAGNVAIWAAVLRDHRRSQEHSRELLAHQASPKKKDVVSPALRKELEQATRTQLNQVVEKATGKLAGDLRGVTTRLTARVDQLTTKVIEEEVAAYRSALDEERQAATATARKIKEAVASQQSAIEQAVRSEQAAIDKAVKLEQAAIRKAIESERAAAAKRAESAVVEQRERLGQAVDDRFSDIVASYLVETLGAAAGSVSQQPQVLAALEEHKADLKKELGRDV